MTLRDLGEFGFIDEIRSRAPAGDAIVGIGDDAAVLEPSPGRGLVASVDALVEGVHFRWEWSKPADVGHKAVSASVSDLAAMGARTRWVLVALSAPGDTTADRARGIVDGIVQACEGYGAQLVGGDLTHADRMVVSVTALGEVEGDPLLRSGAKVGDTLAVTGPLGRAAAGLNLLLSQDPSKVSVEDATVCLDAHRRPVARVEQGLALRAAAVHAAIDVSDGLASDVRRLADASGVGVEIDADLVPVAPEARRVAQARGWDVERMALGGGEDYELLVAVLPERLDAIGVELLPVGRVVEEGVWIVRDGDRRPIDASGWDHFS